MFSSCGFFVCVPGGRWAANIQLRFRALSLWSVPSSRDGCSGSFGGQTVSTQALAKAGPRLNFSQAGTMGSAGIDLGKFIEI